MPGQPAFLKIENSYVRLYPVLSTSLTNFILPQDGTLTDYIVNDGLHFSIDTNKLLVPKDVVAKTRFTWEFGDGNKIEGLSVIHSYQHIGSYIAKLHAHDGTTVQMIDSTFLNILPYKDYQLPQATFTVNGFRSKEPLVDIASLDFAKEAYFDASFSTSSNSIISYFWDFGDTTSSTGGKTHHLYSQKLRMVFPLLRVTDKNGFISDTYIQINNQLFDIQKNSLKTTPRLDTQKKPSRKPSQLSYLSIGLLLIVTLFVIKKLFIKRRNI